MSTTSNSVRGPADDEGITLTSAVLVQPSPTSVIADGMTVVVNPARVAPGAEAFLAASAPTQRRRRRHRRRGVRKPHRCGGLGDGRDGLGSVDLTDLLVESDFSASSAGTSPAVSAQVVVLGKVREVLTNADTAGELLSAMGIQPDADDRVRPSPETPLHAGTTVTFDEVRVVTEMEAVTIPFDVQTEYTPRMTPGTPVKVLAGGQRRSRHRHVPRHVGQRRDRVPSADRSVDRARARDRDAALSASVDVRRHDRGAGRRRRLAVGPGDLVRPPVGGPDGGASRRCRSARSSP